MLRQAIQDWIAYYKKDKVLFCIEALGTLCEMIAALTLAFFSAAPPMIVIYPFYMAGSLCFIYTTHKRKVHWLTGLMTFYLITSSFGFVKLF